jgi:hypothetical protein
MLALRSAGGVMTNKERRADRAKPASPRTEGPEPRSSPGDAPMDRWFQQQLTLLYNDVVNEPLPKEFLEILGKIGKDKPPS